MIWYCITWATSASCKDEYIVPPRIMLLLSYNHITTRDYLYQRGVAFSARICNYIYTFHRYVISPPRPYLNSGLANPSLDLGMDAQLYPTQLNGCNYLSMPWLSYNLWFNWIHKFDYICIVLLNIMAYKVQLVLWCVSTDSLLSKLYWCVYTALVQRRTICQFVPMSVTMGGGGGDTLTMKSL